MVSFVKCQFANLCANFGQCPWTCGDENQKYFNFHPKKSKDWEKFRRLTLKIQGHVGRTKDDEQ